MAVTTLAPDQPPTLDDTTARRIEQAEARRALSLQLISGAEELPDLAAVLLRRPAWHADAACRGADPGLFFLASGADPRPGQALCAGCPVRAECLDQALEGREQGTWGGLSERARRKLRADA